MSNGAAQLDPLVQAMATGSTTTVKVFLLLTAMSFATAALLSLTSFTRIIIVLSFLRQARGTPQLPPNQVLLGLSLFLTMFIMAPTAGELHERALGPFLEDKMNYKQAAQVGGDVIKGFLLRHTREDDLKTFYEISNTARPAKGDDIPLTIAAPAFMISELTTAFQMGLYVFVPLMLVDILVASILMSLGMSMLPPTVVALPLKIGIFLLADGWRLVMSALARSF